MKNSYKVMVRVMKPVWVRVRVMIINKKPNLKTKLAS